MAQGTSAAGPQIVTFGEKAHPASMTHFLARRTWRSTYRIT
jgi:hypothetical protein